MLLETWDLRDWNQRTFLAIAEVDHENERLSLKWIESSPTAIPLQNTPPIWNSGRVNDILHPGNDVALVASESGGLWLAIPDGGSRGLGTRSAQDHGMRVAASARW